MKPLALALTVWLLACAPSASPPAAQPGLGAPTAPAAATAAGASGSAPSPTAPPVLERVRLAYPATAYSFLPLWVAIDQGFHAANGIEAEPMLTAAAVAITGLTTGDMDFTYSLGSAARAAARGLPVRVVEQSGDAPQLYILAQPELRTMADLRGKVLSPNSISGTTGQTAILLLRRHGVDPQSVQLMPGVDATRQMEMLRQRQIDAVLLGPPFPALARREGYNQLASAPDELSFSFTGLSTSQDIIARRGDMLRRVIKSEIEALRYIHADRAGALRIMERRYEAEPEVAAQAYDLTVSSFSRDGAISREGMENVLALDKEEGAIPENVQFEDVADPRPIQDVHRALGLVR